MQGIENKKKIKLLISLTLSIVLFQVLGQWFLYFVQEYVFRKGKKVCYVIPAFWKCHVIYELMHQIIVRMFLGSFWIVKHIERKVN